MALAAKALNADGFALLERLKRGHDPELIALINRCAVYARTKKDLELIEHRKLFAGEKPYPEEVMVHALYRLLINLT